MAVTEKEPLGCISGRIRGGIVQAFERYGQLTTRSPWASMLFAALFVAACLPGIFIMEYVNEDVNFYIKGSYSWRALERIEELWPNDPRRTSNTLWAFNKDGRNLFEPDALLELGRAMDTLTALKTQAGESYEEVCLRGPDGSCKVDSIFFYFRSLMASSLNLTTPSGMGESEGLAYHLGAYCSGNVTACGELLAPVAGQLFVAPVTNVRSLMFVWHLDPLRTGPDGEDSFLSHQVALLEYNHAPDYAVYEDRLQTDNFYTFVISEAGISLEGGRPATTEMPLIGAAAVIILVFVCVGIFAPTKPHCRTLLGLSCLLIVGLSLACAAGLSAYTQTPLTSMSLLVVFTLLGVSVDDIIVIVHAYDRLPGDPTLETCDQRVVESLKESGTAVTITSATSLAAFAVAASNPIPALSFFCITAAFGILCIYVLQILLFVPLFVLHERRRLRGRMDCCLSLCMGKADAPGTTVELPLAVRVFVPSSVGGGCSLLERYAKFMAQSRIARTAVWVLFVVALGLGIWGAAAADAEVDLTNYYIDDSFMKGYFDLKQEHWGSRAEYSVVVEHNGEGFFSDARISELDHLYGNLTALSFIVPPYWNWLDDYQVYLTTLYTDDVALSAEKERLRGDPVAFGASVQAFLVADLFVSPYDGRSILPDTHANAISFSSDGTIRATRFETYFEAPLHDPTILFENQRQAQEVVFPLGQPEEGFDGARVDGTFDYTSSYLIADRDRDIVEIIFKNLLFACAAVGCIVILMLNPLVGLFVTFLVVALDIIILALLTLYGQKLDFVAFICLSMTIGLVVDYSTHTAYVYLVHVGTPEEKLYHAISKMGASVFSGGGSTVLGIGVLAFAKSEAFRTFFKVLGTAVFLGTGVGVTVSPVLLLLCHRVGLWLSSWVAPQRSPGEGKQEKAEGKHELA